jgi:hypothetical protein
MTSPMRLPCDSGRTEAGTASTPRRSWVPGYRLEVGDNGRKPRAWAYPAAAVGGCRTLAMHAGRSGGWPVLAATAIVFSSRFEGAD